MRNESRWGGERERNNYRPNRGESGYDDRVEWELGGRSREDEPAEAPRAASPGRPGWSRPAGGSGQGPWRGREGGGDFEEQDWVRGQRGGSSRRSEEPYGSRPAGGYPQYGSGSGEGQSYRSSGSSGQYGGSPIDRGVSEQHRYGEPGYGRSAEYGPGADPWGYGHTDMGSQGGYSGSSYGGSGYGAGGYGGSQYAGYGPESGAAMGPGYGYRGGSSPGRSPFPPGNPNEPRARGRSETGRGPYAGRGPKGYRRDDNRIREDVSEELTNHPDIDASEIEVKVEAGEITLTGSVPDRESKRLAEDVAERCSGVKEVQNQLRVTPSGSSSPSASYRSSSPRVGQ